MRPASPSPQSQEAYRVSLLALYERMGNNGSRALFPGLLQVLYKR